MKKYLSPQIGMMMIEVLVAIVILSFGMLGLVGLQAAVMANAMNAEDRTEASLLADDIVSLMWLNQTLTLPAADVTTWTTRVASSKLKGVGTITQNPTGTEATITIVWKAPTKKSTDASNTYYTKVSL